MIFVRALSLFLFLALNSARAMPTPEQEAMAVTQAACEASPDWDGRLCKLQVTEAGERAMQLRVLVTSASSGQNWDLRCTVREALIAFIQREYPASLPRVRAELEGAPPPGHEPNRPLAPA